MSWVERFGLKGRDGSPLEYQTFGKPAVDWVLDKSLSPNRLLLSLSYATLELVVPFTARLSREGRGCVPLLTMPIADRLTFQVVEYAFNSQDNLTSALIMGAAAIITRSITSQLAVNVLDRLRQRKEGRVIDAPFGMRRSNTV